ncbi:MAG TPA: ABC transporter permease subunit [Candidatus Lokiarchaeia archaeon]|nr:ABC transporter permease subunit [Candidatus Lokiarchaeia archaeon]
MLRLGLLIKLSRKDWHEIRSNRQVLLPMILMPVIFAVVYPLLIVGGPLSDPSSIIGQFGSILNYLNYMVGDIIRPIFVMIPMLVTLAIAADSWAGEKERKTAESILLLPLTDTELFVAKVLASFIPGLIITWISGAILSTIVDSLTYSLLGFLYMPNVSWLFILFVLSPVLSFFTIYIDVWVSYRARDTKSAQQIGGTVMVIFIAVLVSGFLGVIELVLLILTACFAVLDVIMIYFSPRVFSRENIIAKF